MGRDDSGKYEYRPVSIAGTTGCCFKLTWTIREGHLHWRGKLYIPHVADAREQMVTEAHTSLSAGHPGTHRTVQLLARTYYWPSLRQDVAQFV